MSVMGLAGSGRELCGRSRSYGRAERGGVADTGQDAPVWTPVWIPVWIKGS
jgi:hypothetical protein